MPISDERLAFNRLVENSKAYDGCDEDFDLLDKMIKHYVKYGWKTTKQRPANSKDILIQLQFRFVIGHYSKATNRWYDYNMFEIKPERIIAWKYIDKYRGDK